MYKAAINIVYLFATVSSYLLAMYIVMGLLGHLALPALSYKTFTHFFILIILTVYIVVSICISLMADGTK